MRSSLEHLPERKQRELARVVEIIHEEFADALEGSSAAFKKRGRILKVILFGSYARGTWVDEPHTMKGYRSDYDILVIVSSKKLSEPQYREKATDRLLWDKGVSNSGGADRARRPGGEQLPGRWTVFFRRYSARGRHPLRARRSAAGQPKPLSPTDTLRLAQEHFEGRFPEAQLMLRTAVWQAGQIGDVTEWGRLAAFSLHQLMSIPTRRFS